MNESSEFFVGMDVHKDSITFEKAGCTGSVALFLNAFSREKLPLIPVETGSRSINAETCTRVHAKRDKDPS
jgi:hypothetical protein